MTWVRTSDDILMHPKFIIAGPQAYLLWSAVLGRCCAVNSGVFGDAILQAGARLAGKSPKETAKLTDALVDVGLWHDHQTIRSCPRCAAKHRLAADQRCYHDFSDQQFDPDQAKNDRRRVRDARRKRLESDRVLCRRIIERDRAMCRYCGRWVDFEGNRQEKHGATFDHVDPFGANTYENVVVACRKCNGDKKDRTPDEAGMPLLPIPTITVIDASASADASSEAPRNLRGGVPGDSEDHARHAREGGRSEEVPRTLRGGSGLAGAGRVGAGLAGLVRSQGGGGTATAPATTTARSSDIDQPPEEEIR